MTQLVESAWSALFASTSWGTYLPAHCPAFRPRSRTEIIHTAIRNRRRPSPQASREPHQRKYLAHQLR
jgi:hypothetical protein